jgi:uncharacterized membrane protein
MNRNIESYPNGVVLWRALLALALGAASVSAQPSPSRPRPYAGLYQGAAKGRLTGHRQAPSATAVRAVQRQHPSYIMIPIDLVPGKTQITPNDLNSKGQVIGTAVNEWGVDGVGYQFSESGTQVLPGLPPAFYIWPICINDRNQIVGQAYFGDPTDITFVGWFWKPGLKELARLSPLRNADGWVSGSGINHAGQIVGLSGTPTPFQCDAVLWESYKAQPTKLKGLPGAPVTDAWIINNNKPPQIAGWAFLDSFWGHSQALFWRQPDAVPEVLPGLGGDGDQATSINDSQQIAGYCATDPDDPSGSLHAVLWEHGKLTELAPDYTYSQASGNTHAINNAGQIVGCAMMEDGLSHAVLWEKTGSKIKMIDLNDQIAQPSNYLLYYADGINDDGCIVVDAYEVNDPAQLNRAFLLVPDHRTNAPR